MKLINGNVYALGKSTDPYYYIFKLHKLEEVDSETVGKFTRIYSSKLLTIRKDNISEFKTGEIFLATRINDVREASYDEIKHFDACVEVGMYVKPPKDEIINSYQIF